MTRDIVIVFHVLTMHVISCETPILVTARDGVPRMRPLPTCGVQLTATPPLPSERGHVTDYAREIEKLEG